MEITMVWTNDTIYNPYNRLVSTASGRFLFRHHHGIHLVDEILETSRASKSGELRVFKPKRQYAILSSTSSCQPRSSFAQNSLSAFPTLWSLHPYYHGRGHGFWGRPGLCLWTSSSYSAAREFEESKWWFAPPMGAPHSGQTLRCMAPPHLNVRISISLLWGRKKKCVTSVITNMCPFRQL